MILDRRIKAAPLLYYRNLIKNHRKQTQFHEAGKTYRRRFFFGANQSGKTTAGGHEALGHSYGYRFWEIPDLRLTPDGDLPPRDHIDPAFWIRRPDGIPIKVPNLGVITTGLSRGRGIGENLWPFLEGILPQALRRRKSGLHVVRGQGGIPEKFTLPNGSRVIFSSEEQDDFQFEGFVADWWWCDEPVRQKIYNAMQARLAANLGPMWFTLTPLGARSAWMMPFYREPPDDVYIVQVVQRDNPAMTADKRKAFEEAGEWPEREKAARLRGEFEVMGDRVYEEYDPDVHLVDDFAIPRDWVRGLTVDPHHKRPAFMLWWAYDPNTQSYYFYREWPNYDFFKARSGGLTPVEYATIIRNAEGRFPASRRICDPRFGKAEHQRHGYKETCWVDQMADVGLDFDAHVPNTGNLEYRHQVISKMLRWDKRFEIGPSNQPQIMVFRSLTNLDKAFRHYGYLDVDNPVKGLFKKVSEEFKDPMDTVAYTVLCPPPLTAAEVKALQRWTPEDLEKENTADDLWSDYG